MPKGTVAWFSARRGSGFIVPDGGGVDSLVQIATGFAILNEGQRLASNVNRKRGRRFSPVYLRPVD
jgi:CspA family cold shock protein